MSLGRRWLVVTGLAAVALAVLVAYLAWPDPKKETACPGGDCVYIGPGEPLYLGTLLAVGDGQGDDALTASQMAIDYLDGRFNGDDGLLLGHQVELINEDDGCSPAGGSQGAERLLQENKILGIIGTTCSSAALGQADQLTSARKVLLVSPSNSAPGLTDSDRHERFYFRTAPNDLIQSEVAADFAYTGISRRRAATLFTADAYSRQLAGAFGSRIRLKGASVVSSSVIRGRSSVSPALRAAAKGRADVLFLPVLQSGKPACSDVVAEARATPGLEKTAIIVSEGCQDREFLKDLGARANGVYASGPDSSGLARNAFYRREFLPAFKERSGNGPRGVYATNAFDATNLLFGAIRRASRQEPGGGLVISREKLRSALLAVDGYSGLSGTLSCGPTGDCAKGAKVAIYEAPRWPVVDPRARPVFARYKTIAELRAAP